MLFGHVTIQSWLCLRHLPVNPAAMTFNYTKDGSRLPLTAPSSTLCFLSSRVEVSVREAGAPHRRPWAASVPGGRAGVHSIFPGEEGPAAPPRQPLHLRSPGDGQDGLPQLCAAGDEGTFNRSDIWLCGSLVTPGWDLSSLQLFTQVLHVGEILRYDCVFCPVRPSCRRCRRWWWTVWVCGAPTPSSRCWPTSW